MSDELQRTLLRIDRKVDALIFQRDELLAALKEVKSRIEDMPQYAELTPEEEERVGGDAAELSYLARVCGDAIAKAEGGSQ